MCQRTRRRSHLGGCSTDCCDRNSKAILFLASLLVLSPSRPTVPGVQAFSLPPAQERLLSFDAAWTESHQRYLQKHQVIDKRKSLGRIWELTRLAGPTLLQGPLLCSLFQKRSTGDNRWTGFWKAVPCDDDKEGDCTPQQRKQRKQQEQLAQLLPRLGPTYVKLGQAVATRPDILENMPTPLADAIANLHDAVPPFDNDTAKSMIRRECVRTQRRWRKRSDKHPYLSTEADLQTFLASVSDQPVAAASMANVYKAYLPGFGPVAVKVQ